MLRNAVKGGGILDARFQSATGSNPVHHAPAPDFRRRSPSAMVRRRTHAFLTKQPLCLRAGNQIGETTPRPEKCPSALAMKRSSEAWLASGDQPAMCGVSSTLSNAISVVGGFGSVS